MIDRQDDDEARSGQRQRRIVEARDEGDAHDDAGHDVGNHEKRIERTGRDSGRREIR